MTVRLKLYVLLALIVIGVIIGYNNPQPGP